MAPSLPPTVEDQARFSSEKRCDSATNPAAQRPAEQVQPEAGTSRPEKGPRWSASVKRRKRRQLTSGSGGITHLGRRNTRRARDDELPRGKQRRQRNQALTPTRSITATQRPKKGTHTTGAPRARPHGRVVNHAGGDQVRTKRARIQQGGGRIRPGAIQGLGLGSEGREAFVLFITVINTAGAILSWHQTQNDVDL